MLKNNVKWPLNRFYRSKTDWEPAAFFADCLCNGTQFDLELGFFSSSAINVLADGFALFLYNGGKMRMVINNILSEDDKQLVMESWNGSLAIPFDLANLKMLKNTLSKRDKHFFDCLSYLISEKRLDIKVVQPKGESGIAHTKQGVFSDGENRVGFSGSCNFTGAALLTNIESISVFCDWENGFEKIRVNSISNSFEKLFNGEDDSVIYLESDEIFSFITDAFPIKELKDILEQEEKLYESKKDKIRPAIKQAMDRAKKEIEQKMKEAELIKTQPRFPFEKPREYQQLAFERWKLNKQRGLFAMATGTGKTITSLNCLLEIYKKLGYYKAIILVPTITLADQWEDECRKFNFHKIVKINSKNPRWSNEVADIYLQERVLSDEDISYIVICTYASFSKGRVFESLNQLSHRTLFIADECHNMGSPALLKLFSKINFKRRIGLSATPERQYDSDGTNKILNFFGSGMEYTYEYSMKDAIENGVLCRYFYYPHLVELTEDEMEEYQEVSRSIAKYYNAEKDSFKNDPILTALLLKRKRIIHKAFNKLYVFKDILEQAFKAKGNLKYTMVYVPEGNDTNDYYESDFYSTNDEDVLDEDTLHLIDAYTKTVISIDSRVTARKFISGVKDRDEILQDFAIGGIDTLTSMKCLDEGVDVPRAELAIFASSTENPRQFIQRRGRILRKHKDKNFACIHDLVVVPKVSRERETFELEKNMLRRELARVSNFSKLAENTAHATEVLYDTMNYYNLNLYSYDE